MNTRCLINGELSDTIAVSDRGFQYGDGLFETLAVYQGACEFWERHMHRLLRGCECLRIPAPDTGLLEAEAAKLTEGQARAVLKIIITRGSGGRGYQIPPSPQPTRVLQLSDWREQPADYAVAGVRLRTCQQRLSRNPALAGVKHLNRLEQVLARSEWNEPDIAEGLMLDELGQVIEGTFTNLFLVKDGKLITPRLDHCGVAGILRTVIIDLAFGCKIECSEQTVMPERVLNADELFVTNSLIGIWPVRALDQHSFLPGPVTRQLQHALTAFRQTQGT
jgi:4-amino-4-deoxychorismate lyase